MEDLVIIDKIKKAIKNAEAQIEETMMSGGVDNMEKIQVFIRTGTCLSNNTTGNL